MKLIYFILSVFIGFFASGQEIHLVLPIYHTDRISSVEYSPNGKYILTASEDNTAKIWDSETGNLLHSLEGHTEEIRSATWSPDGKRIVTASWDKSAKTWDSESGKLLHSLEGHTYGVYSATWSPDGKKVFTVSYDNTAKTWDSGYGNLLYSLNGHTEQVLSATWSSDGKRIVTASDDKTAKIWDSESGKLLQSLERHTEKIRSAIWSPDGKWIVTVSDDKTAKIWDSETGNLLHSLEGHTYGVCSATWSPDGKRIVTTSYDSTAKIWESESGKLLHSLEGHTEEIRSATWSPDGKRIVTVSDDKTAKIWDSESGKLLHSLEGHTYGGCSAIWSPDGKRIVTASDDNTAKIWESESGKLLHSLGGHTYGVCIATWSPDEKRIVTTSDNTAKIWDSGSGNLLHILKGYTEQVLSATWSPDGKRIVTVSDDKTAKIWDSESGKLLHSLEGHTYGICSATWSPDGKRIVTASWDSTAKVWDSESGKLLQSLERHTGAVLSAIWSPDGKRIVTASFDKTVKIWDSKSGKLLHSLWHISEVYSATWSPDGKKIVTTFVDKTAEIWDSKSGKLLHSLEGHTYGICSATWSPDGKRIVTASSDNTAIIWDSESGKLLQSLGEHTDGVYSATWSPDGKRIVTASLDNTAKIWNAESGKLMNSINLESFYYQDINFKDSLFISSFNSQIKINDLNTGKEVLQFISIDSTNYIVLHPDGYFDGTPGVFEKMYFTKGLEIIPLEAYYEQFYRPNLWERIMSGEEIEKASIEFQNQKPTPEIKITNPPNEKIEFRGDNKVNMSTDKADFILEYSITDRGGGINEIRIFHNGKLVYITAESINQKDKVLSKTFSLKLLGGINTIKVTAFNNDRIEKSETTIIEYTGKETESSKLFVLAIGINEYQKSSYNLNYAIPDVNAFTDAITKGANDIFASVHITSLQNSQATKANITKAVKEITAQSNPNDVFVFYYAGHGSMSVVEEGQQSVFYLAPYEVTNLYSDEILKVSGISAGELQNFSKEIKAQKQLFVLDACQSGGAVNTLVNRGAVEEKAMAILARSTGTYFLTASGSEQFAGEFASLGHGVFTYAILMGLSGGEYSVSEKLVSVKELSLLVEKNVPALSEKYKGAAQYPVSYGFGQDFPLVMAGKYRLEEKTVQPESKYAKYSVEELEKMMKEAADKLDFDLAKELKLEIERRQ
ncbi:MAG: caspase family protein [Bacteroidota bacterium]